MGEERKREILQAAFEIVGKEGLEGLHARSVAAAVGINHAAVHYYYPKRTDLLVAVADYAFQRFSNDRSRLMEGTNSYGEKVEAHLAQAEAYCKPKSRFIRNWVSFFVAGINDPKVRAELVRHLREWSVSLDVDLENGSREGTVRADSPFCKGSILVSTLLGLMISSQVLGEASHASEQLDAIAYSLLP